MISGIPEREIERAAYFVAGLYPGAMDSWVLAGLLAVELVSRVPEPPDDFSTPEKRSQTLVRWCGEVADRWANQSEQHYYSTTEVRHLLEKGGYWRVGEEKEAQLDLQEAIVRVPFWHQMALRRIATDSSGDIGWGDIPEVIEELTREMNRRNGR